MLFRTKVILSFSALAVVAVGCAILLLVSAQLNERSQKQSSLAQGTLTGYFRLSSEVFRTFKLIRRDLLSEDAALTFDLDAEKASIFATIDRIERNGIAESEFLAEDEFGAHLANTQALRGELVIAFDMIERGADLLASGQTTEGRTLVIQVLESKIDAHVSELMEGAIRIEQDQLANVRADLEAFRTGARFVAWMSVVTALLLSATVYLALVRRFGKGLKLLSAATEEYARDNLAYRVSLPGSDELSDVASSMSNMAKQLEAKRMDLVQARTELERRVQERTVQLHSANTELKERDDRRRQFFADIGHELRTPVTAIRGEAEVALRAKRSGDDNCHMRDALTRIVEFSGQLTENVDDLFLIARGEAGVLEFDDETIDVNQAVSQAAEQMRTTASRVSAKISMDNHPAAIKVDGNSNRLTQLVRILLTNALAHGRDGVEIEVSTSCNATHAILCVADNGPGIARSDRGKIFDRYVRGTVSNTNRSPGTGLGLAIAKSIAEAHGGTITAEQSLTGGAAFCIALPLSKEAA